MQSSITQCLSRARTNGEGCRRKNICCKNGEDDGGGGTGDPVMASSLVIDVLQTKPEIQHDSNHSQAGPDVILGSSLPFCAGDQTNCLAATIPLAIAQDSFYGFRKPAACYCYLLFGTSLPRLSWIKANILVMNITLLNGCSKEVHKH